MRRKSRRDNDSCALVPGLKDRKLSLYDNGAEIEGLLVVRTSALEPVYDDHRGLELSMPDKAQAVMRLRHLISWRNAEPPFSTRQIKPIHQGPEPHRDVFVTTIIISLHNVCVKAVALQ